MIEAFGLGCGIRGRSLLKDISLRVVPGGMTVVLGKLRLLFKQYGRRAPL